MTITDPRWVRAISHPLRSRLLALLEEQPASPAVLAERLGERLGTVAYHVRLLHELGLIDLVSTRQRRGATEHFYKARAHPRFSDEAWAELGPVAKQRILTSSLARIHEWASMSAAAGGFDRTDAHFTRSPLKLDERGWTELAKATKKWLVQVETIQAKAAHRLEGKPHEGLEVGLTILLFEAVPLGSAPSTDAQHKPHKQRRRRAARVAESDDS
jgi:DNA-binding transcriptional ArsR family regulator